ncbi:MAG TPA: DUF3467 domain-containing protein [Terriglobales bacterium]|nr:DUF3467 domain-containing protein [Terriglobales bacterium]
MSQPPTPPRIKVVVRPDYRDNYANSVQVRPSTWDFFFQFGTMDQKIPDEIEIHMVQGIYLSPQQAKALLGLLQTHVANYEKAFGEIQLTPAQGNDRVQ